MSKPLKAVVTANDLADGFVVFRTAAGGWVQDPAAAEVITEADALEAALAQAKQDEATRIVGPYAVDLTDDAALDAATPGKFRERIRVGGPTVRRDLGRQATEEAPQAEPGVF